MDKKYVAQVIAMPHTTIKMLDIVRDTIQKDSGITKISRRQTIEFLVNFYRNNTEDWPE